MITTLKRAAIASALMVSMAVPALAQNTNSNAKELNAACMQSAVEKRDDALIAAVDKYANAVKPALATRRDALKDAWTKTDRAERRQALRAAWKAYKEALSKVRRELRTSRLGAWKEYVKGRKECGSRGVSDDPTTAGVDAQL